METTGLEPATPCLQSRCSSHLSYVPSFATCPAPQLLLPLEGVSLPWERVARSPRTRVARELSWPRGPATRVRSGKACQVEPLIEILGAVLLLSGFALSQLGRLRTESLTYLLLNLAGSGILAFTAAFDGDIGFLLLETVWAGVSGYGAVRLLVRR